MELLKNIWVEEDGQGLAEYGLILALIAVACITALGLLSGGIQGILGNLADELTPTP